MAQCVENRVAGLPFCQHHADAKDRCEHEDTHAVIRGQRGKYIGRDEGKNAEIWRTFDLCGVSGIDGELDIDAVSGSTEQRTDVRDHSLIHDRIAEK